MVDVRRLKMLQMVQLFKCEEDALQVRHTYRHKGRHAHAHAHAHAPSVLMGRVCVCVLSQ